ncbi:unnamed protein product [Auanema sp. JU1783]|nr:unnamed protein product [Auanema sp. JU1783]
MLNTPTSRPGLDKPKTEVKNESVANKETETIVKEEIKKDVEYTNGKPAPKAVSGRDIIAKYKKGDPVALVSYKKICNALSIMEKWEPTAKIHLLEQFVDLSDIFDDKCMTIVNCLASLSWASIPSEIFPRYQTLLCDIALRQVCHTQTIYTSAVKNLIPKSSKVVNEENVESVDVTVEEQEKVYVYAHQIIARIYECLPMSCKMLSKCVKVNFPHYSQKTEILVGYLRNVIQITEYTTRISNELWETIIENVLQCDVFLTKKESENESGLSTLFSLKNETEEETGNSNNVGGKLSVLGGAIRDILVYLSIKHTNKPIENIDSSWFRPGSLLKADDSFKSFLAILESKMLMSVHARFSSFIWFYLCSLEESYPERILDFLWTVITRPQRAQSDAKKAQGAAAYMAAFLARAKYLKIGVTFDWMSRIFKWLLQYVDQSSGTSGGSRHGTFYSLCQTFFIVFSFRYKDLVKSADMEEIRRWGLGRVVHSALEPLKFVSKPVGLCFGAITRSLQLVYCNHVLPVDYSVNKPFEEMFPFDVYRLQETAFLISPLMRKFSPFAEDISMLSSALSTSKEGPNDENDMDFLDNDDDALIHGSYRERSNTLSMCGAQSSMFTVYSSSPGLRQYDSSYTR